MLHCKSLIYRLFRIAICGAIEFDSKDKNSNQVEISVTSRKTNEVTRIPKITETNNHFCEFVSPGIYTLMVCNIEKYERFYSILIIAIED